MKKIRVERVFHQPSVRTDRMRATEFMLFAERVEEIFRQQREGQADTTGGNTDEFEVITEWL